VKTTVPAEVSAKMNYAARLAGVSVPEAYSRFIQANAAGITAEDIVFNIKTAYSDVKPVKPKEQRRKRKAVK
jgi:hypothetical protein